MRWIADASLKFQRLVVAVAAGVLAVGVYQVGKAPVDILPEFGPTTVEVQTEALGLSAAEVEQLITAPLEQDLLVGVAFLETIESVSLPGLSSVVMNFEPGTDVLHARQLVQERLTQAVGVAGLPAVAKPPQMIQPLSSSSRVAMVKLTSEQLTPIEMSVLARWVISPRLLGVPGVANVAIWGNREQQLQVQVDPERLRQNGVTLAQIVRTAGNALEVSPLTYLEASKPGTGGFIDTANQRLNIFHEQAISTPTQLAQVPVEGENGETAARRAGPVALGDVTEVVEDHQPLIGDTACAGGEECLLLVLEKFPNADTPAVAEGIDDALEALAPGLVDMRLDSSVYQPSSYIESSFTNLGWALLAGFVALLLLVLVFLWDWRRTVIVVATMGVSAAAAILVLASRGTTINLLVVAGLLVGLTAVIDDAVTDTNGLAERMRRHRETDSGPIWSTVVAAASSIRSSALYAVLIVAAATLPLLFLDGQGGEFLPPVALSYLLAVAASMLVALVVTPALAVMLLSGAPLGGRQSPLMGWVHKKYDQRAPQLFTRTGVGLAAFGVLALAGLVAAPFLTTSMSPSVKERVVLVAVEAAPGTSLTKMTGVAAQAVDDLSAVPGVSDVNAQVGRAIMSDKDADVDQGEVWVSIASDADYDATVASIENTVSGYPDVTSEVMTYSDQRVRELLVEDDSDVVVRIYGQDSEVLETKSAEIEQMLASVDGITAVNLEATPQQSTIEVEADLAKTQELGITPGDVRRTAAMMLGGITVGNLFQEQKVFDVVVWGAPSIRDDEADIERLLIDTPDGGSVPLGDVADVRNVSNDAVIRHDSVSRYVELTADVSGRDVADVNAEVGNLVQDTSFPLDHHAELIDGYADRQADRSELITVALAAAIAIFLLLQAAFRSWRVAGIAFLSLPVALVGGVLAVLITGGNLTLGSVAGLLAVLGIAARGVTMLIRHLLQLERREGMAFGRDLVVLGTRDRVAPTVMSAVVIAAMLLPIAAIGSATTGLELLAPAAITILGGLVTTTLVSLFIVPMVYLKYGAAPDRDSWADDLLEPVREMDLSAARSAT